MTFQSLFQKPFAKAFPQESEAVVAGDWWLSGDISVDDCVAAYQPKGAASLDASYVNLANPGTYDIVEKNAPTWDAVNGWRGNQSASLDTRIVDDANSDDGTWSVFIRLKNILSTGYIFKGQTWGDNFGILITIPGSRYIFTNDGTRTQTGGFSSGVIGIAGKSVYYNSVNVNTIDNGEAKFFGPTFHIFSATLGQTKSDIEIQAFAMFRITHPAPAAIVAAMNAL